MRFFKILKLKGNSEKTANFLKFNFALIYKYDVNVFKIFNSGVRITIATLYHSWSNALIFGRESLIGSFQSLSNPQETALACSRWSVYWVVRALRYHWTCCLTEMLHWQSKELKDRLAKIPTEPECSMLSNGKRTREHDRASAAHSYSWRSPPSSHSFAMLVPLHNRLARWFFGRVWA